MENLLRLLSSLGLSAIWGCGCVWVSIRLLMSTHPTEPFIVELAVPAVGVLLAMGWYKLTSRRNRPFEPTLWFLFRWGFIVIVLTELVGENADYLLRLHRSNPGPFILGTVVAIIVVFTPAVLHWRRAVPKDRMKPAIS